jgi:hypothetical protein
VARPDRAKLRATWRKWLWGAVSDRLLYKASALFLALVLWLVVNAEEPTEDTVPVRLVLEYDSTRLALASPAPPMRALVVGRARDVTRLYSIPPEVRRSIPTDIGDSVRFEFRPSDVSPPAGLQGEFRVRQVDPGVVTLYFETRARRRVPVRSRLRVTVDSALRQVGAPQVVPESVTVVGTRERVDAVESVPTEIADVRVRDTIGVVVALDTTGLDVAVQPPRVRIRVPVVRDTLYTLPSVLPFGRPQFVPPRRP